MWKSQFLSRKNLSDSASQYNMNNRREGEHVQDKLRQESWRRLEKQSDTADRIDKTLVHVWTQHAYRRTQLDTNTRMYTHHTAHNTQHTRNYSKGSFGWGCTQRKWLRPVLHQDERNPYRIFTSRTRHTIACLTLGLGQLFGHFISFQGILLQ